MIADVYPVMLEDCTQLLRNKSETSSFLFQFQKYWVERHCIFMKFVLDHMALISHCAVGVVVHVLWSYTRQPWCAIQKYLECDQEKESENV